MSQTTPTGTPPPAESTSPNSDQPPRPESDARFFLIVGVLMLVIIALLSGLWLRAHLRTAQLEAQVIAAHADRAKLEDFLKSYLLQNPPPQVVRGELTSRPAVLDGKDISLLRLGAEPAAKLGLRPGDVLVVDPPAASGPASRTAPAKLE
jgi:hypothetical protein